MHHTSYLHNCSGVVLVQISTDVSETFLQLELLTCKTYHSTESSVCSDFTNSDAPLKSILFNCGKRATLFQQGG